MHSDLLQLLEVLYDQPTGRLALVFELMDMNIYELIRGRRHYVAEDRVKNYMYQVCRDAPTDGRTCTRHIDMQRRAAGRSSTRVGKRPLGIDVVSGRPPPVSPTPC